MIADFTEELCEGTGATMVLKGATTGRIPFSASFVNGQLVHYAIEDSAGIIKVVGVGTYVSATDDITRNDTWSWNGTVKDDNPSSNITLSSGDHTIRSVPAAANVYIGTTNTSTFDALGSSPFGLPDNVSESGQNSGAFTADRLMYQKVRFHARTVMTSLFYVVTTGDGSITNFRAGIWEPTITGGPGRLILNSGNISSNFTGTGDKDITLASPAIIPAGDYYWGVVCDSTVLRLRYPNADDVSGGAGAMGGWNGAGTAMYSDSITGALTDNPTISGGRAVQPIPMGFRS